MKSQQILTVVETLERAPSIHRLSLRAPEWAAEARAGQFINIQIEGARDILWRRPFSIHRADPVAGTIDLLFAALGRGSRTLSRCRPGDRVDALGLLGNSFQTADDLEEAILVAGGLGIAPFTLFMQRHRSPHMRMVLFYGARSRTQLCGIDELTALASEVHVTTEDGSAGAGGRVTEAVEAYLAHAAPAVKRGLYICGPTPMLRQMRTLAMRFGIPSQVSVENMMACGFGACVGCPVEMAHPPADGIRYWLACKDGPVFPLEEILLHD